MSKLAKSIISVLLFSLLAGCATAYGPDGLAGGYKERKLGEGKYIVSFFGNGYTGEQQVWNYWMYRCAELTIANGYAYFSLTPSAEHAFRNRDEAEEAYSFSMLEDVSVGTDGRVGIQNVYYTYTTVTTYSSKAIVTMYNDPIPPNAGILLHAATIIEQLKPYVMSEAEIESPDRKDVLIRAAVEAAIRTKQIDAKDADLLEERLHQIL